ncbi:MAG: biotin carboxyl carrier domain-containing protein [Chloroflexi bacterium]|nr:biotin carboxyl carrier domain-containing protein [Chloroflexota bacterium]
MSRQQILSPLPGTFYRRPNPTSEPYVTEGDPVTADQTICLIEIMKQFNEVKAGVNGKLVEFLVANEDAVMAGQPIAIVEIE